jgi:hypothetical protein
MSNNPKFEIRYIDLPEISETFADSIGPISINGEATRIELQITRLDEPKPDKQPSARKHPACRLVMPTSVCLELYNQLHGMITHLEKQGVFKRNPPADNQPPAGSKPN